MSRYPVEKLSLSDIAGKLADGSLTSEALCRRLLDQIAAHDGEIHAFLKLDAGKILEAARSSDARRAAGAPLGKFDGVPIGIKDNIAVADESCSCASKLLEPVISPYDATVITRLRAQGFIPFGRLNMDEFAMGSSCENSAFGRTRNPRDPERVPGGSSGGSAAAVAAGFVPVTLGSDTGGSIRQPAAFCGVVGVKPTYGRVSRYGLVAFASSLDQIGPLANSVGDAAEVLDVISGGDHRDSTSLPEAPTACAAAAAEGKRSGSLAGVRFGLPAEYFSGGIAPGVEAVVRQAIERVRQLGGEIVEVSLPHTKYAIATYYILATAEASANLARFDGIRYGARVEGRDLVDTYFETRGAGFGDEVKRRILLGTYVLSSGYYDAYYLRAQKVRTLIRRDFESAFSRCDLLLTPVTPEVAFKFGERSDPLRMYLSDIFTIALNLSGNCGISLPAGVDPDSGMPVGVQFMAPHLGEEAMFRAAAAFEA